MNTPDILTLNEVAAIEAHYPNPEKWADIHALCATVRAAWAELGRRERTMKFWEDSYLAEHETWGNCKWKAENAALREQLAENARRHFDDARSLEQQRDKLEQERNSLRGQVVGLNTRLAQVELARDQLSSGLSVRDSQVSELRQQLAQAEKERDGARKQLQGEQSMDLITDRHLKPEVLDAIKQLKEQP